MTRLLISSDWHGDWSTQGVSRFREIEEAVNHTVETAIQEKVDIYIFGGDLQDPDSGSVSFRVTELALYAAQRLEHAGIYSVWLAGNHDVIEDGSGDTTLAPLRALSRKFSQGPVVVEKPQEFILASTHFVCFPFTASSHPYDPEIIASRVQADSVTLSHLAVPGVQPGEETTEMPRGREVIFPVASTAHARLRLQGHYHRGQTTKEGIRIPGTLARLTFGEESNKPGFLIAEI